MYGQRGECVDECKDKMSNSTYIDGRISAALVLLFSVPQMSFYRPTAERHKIILESKAFPSDHVSRSLYCCLL